MSKSNKFIVAICQLALVTIVSCNSSVAPGDCRKFHQGKFRVQQDYNGEVGIFETTGNRQTSITEGKNDTTVLAVRWINDCQYELHYLAGKILIEDSLAEYYRTHPIKINIIETAENYFIYTSTMEGIEPVLKDTAFRIQ